MTRTSGSDKCVTVDGGDNCCDLCVTAFTILRVFLLFFDIMID